MRRRGHERGSEVGLLGQGGQHRLVRTDRGAVPRTEGLRVHRRVVGQRVSEVDGFAEEPAIPRVGLRLVDLQRARRGGRTTERRHLERAQRGDHAGLAGRVERRGAAVDGRADGERTRHARRARSIATRVEVHAVAARVDVGP